MKNNKLRVAVIGCGAVAQRRHLPEYAAREDVEIIAVVDKKKDRAAEVAFQFKAPRHFTDYKAALALRPDAVSVSPPRSSTRRTPSPSSRPGRTCWWKSPCARRSPRPRR